MEPHPENPGSPDVIESLRRLGGNRHITVLMAASKRDFNEHTLSSSARSRSIKARRLAAQKGKETRPRAGPLRILATGDQGTSRKSAQRPAKIRQDPRFERVQSRDWSKGRRLNSGNGIHQRQSQKASTCVSSPSKATAGPSALQAIFKEVDPWHLLDLTFSYQIAELWALKVLELRPDDAMHCGAWP